MKDKAYLGIERGTFLDFSKTDPEYWDLHGSSILSDHFNIFQAEVVA